MNRMPYSFPRSAFLTVRDGILSLSWRHRVIGSWLTYVHRRFIIQRGHERTRTGNESESGFGSLRGTPWDISRCLGGESTPRPYGRLRRRPAAPRVTGAVAPTVGHIHIYIYIQRDPGDRRNVSLYVYISICVHATQTYCECGRRRRRPLRLPPPSI